MNSIPRTIASFIVAWLLHGSNAYQNIAKFRSNNLNSYRSHLSVTSAVLPPADLTPAVDKFLRIPSEPKAADSVYVITAKGPQPAGPDPFKLVADELQPLSDYVKELIVSENPVLTMAASHFFEQVRVTTLVTLIYTSVSSFVHTLTLCLQITETRQTFPTDDCRTHGACTSTICVRVQRQPQEPEAAATRPNHGNDSRGVTHSR